LLTLLLILAAGFVAYTNGANANFKGVASLYGSGTATLRQALWWGTATTCAGSLCAAFLAQGMLARFGGRGLVPDALAQSPHFLFAVALGAALTSLLATKLGFPVSTTHALVGGLLGAGFAGSGANLSLAALGRNFVQPLILSPVIAVGAGAVLYLTLRPLGLAPHRRSRPLDLAHYLSAGAASFARGLNDTPKIAALFLVLGSFRAEWALVAVAVMIVAGGLLDADRVAETLGRKVTALDPGQGFAANLATALLVTTASLHGLPVSTTHVSVGALAGIGIITRRTHWRSVGQICLCWVITLPCAALLSALTYWLVRLAGGS
jgi:PiT family inorganic phosphate transporter